jgi:hypothetical protein
VILNRDSCRGAIHSPYSIQKDVMYIKWVSFFRRILKMGHGLTNGNFRNISGLQTTRVILWKCRWSWLMEGLVLASRCLYRKGKCWCYWKCKLFNQSPTQFLKKDLLRLFPQQKKNFNLILWKESPITDIKIYIFLLNILFLSGRWSWGLFWYRCTGIS